MEKFTVENEYKELVVIAIAVGVAHLGVKPEVLVETLNAKLEEIGEVAFTEAVNAHSVSEAAKQVEEVKTDAPAAVAVKNLKWHQEPGAFGFAENDVVEITGGKVLVGRFAQINKPSNKKEAVKAFLFHEKTGELQATNITVDFVNVKKIDKTPTEITAQILEAGNLKVQAQADAKAAAQTAKEEAKAKRELEKATRIAAAKAKAATNTAAPAEAATQTA